MIVCPNKNDAKWIQLVALVGEDKAYETWLKAEQDLDKIDLGLVAFDVEPVEYNELLIKGFTPATQDEAVLAITEQVLISIKSGNTSLNKAFDIYIAQLNEFVADEDVDPIDKKNYKRVLNNISQLRGLVVDKLNRIGLLDKKRNDLINVIEVGGDEASDGTYWEDDWVFKFDSKANALKKVKEFLLFIPDTTITDKGQYVSTGTHLGTTKYLPFDEVFEDLKGILADTGFTWEAKKERLEEYKTAKPWIHYLLHNINTYNEIQKSFGTEGDVEQLKAQFVSTFNSTYSSSKTILYRDLGVVDVRIIDTDQNSAQKNLEKQWEYNYNKSSLLKNEGEYKVLDTDKKEKYLTSLKELKNSKSEKAIIDTLSIIGIDITSKTAKELLDGKVAGKTFVKQFDGYGVFGLIEARLNGKDAKGLEGSDITNPTINNSALRTLALIEVKNSKSVFTNSYINGENNTVYSYALPKYLTDIYNTIVKSNLEGTVVNKAYLKSLQQLSFQKTQQTLVNGVESPLYENWIYKLENNELLKDYFSLTPFDTTRERDEEGIKLSRMADLDLEFTKFVTFQNNATNIKGLGRISQYLFTIPSKTTSYVVQAPAVDVDVQIGKTVTFSSDVENALYSIVLSEMGRINSSIKSDINKYEDGRKLFYFFPTLKTLPIFNTDGTIMQPSTKVEGGTVESLIRKELINILHNSIKQQIQQWRSLGVVNKQNVLKYLTKDYSAKYASESNLNHRLYKIAADYVVNNQLFMFNMHQMFIGDPALYFKKNVEETWKDLGKRLALQIAPGQTPSLENEDEQFISIKLADREGEYALNKAQLAERLRIGYKDYASINGTDAQEYETLPERLRLLKSFGKISNKLYNTILDRYKKDKDSFTLTKEETIILQPLKPVYTSNTIDIQNDVMKVDYIKSSSIVLLPEFTRGLEINKLRKAMESVEETTGLTVRAAYQSATKVGGTAFAEIFNSDGSIKDDLDLSKNYNRLYRKGLRLQQDIPYGAEYEEVTKGTQATKLLFNNLLSKTINGKSGAVINKEFNKLHETLFSESQFQLNSELLGVDGRLDIVKLSNKLTKEAKERGWSPAEIASLALTPDGKFDIPFWLLTSGKYESLMTSLYTKKIIKQQMHGASYVLASEEGMQGYSEGIIYTDKYEGYLKPYGIKEDGTIQPAQVLLPWRFKVNGKIANIKNYIKDGKLDTSKIPNELLTRFGFRIPTQGHNSMSLIEVVGFLPEVMGDLIIAPRNFVVQMGSDFDVDKLYLFDYYTINDKDGNISKYVYNENEERVSYEQFKVDIIEKINKIDSAYEKERSLVTGDVLVDGLIDTIFADILDEEYTEEEYTQFLSTQGLTREQFDKLVYKMNNLSFEEYSRKNKIKDTKNKIVDIHVEIMSSPQVFEQTVTPLTTGNLKNLAKEMENIIKVDNISYLNPLYHNNKYLEGIDGKSMVGIESLVSVFSVALEREDTTERLRLLKYNGETDDFVIKNKEGQNVYLNDLSNPLTYDGVKRKLEVIASFQSAAVDNEKEPMLYYLNSNPQTSKVKMTMLLLGLDEEYVTYFLNQPVVREYVKQLKNSQSALSRTRTRDAETSILLKLLSEYKEKSKVEKESVLLYQGYSAQELKNLITTPTPVDSYAVLLKFKQLFEYGKSLTQIQSAINIETKGTGKNLLEIVDRKEKYFKAQEVKNIYNISQLFRENYYTSIFNNSIIPAYNSLVAENEYFKYNSEFMRNAYNKVLDNSFKDELTVDDKIKVYNAAKSYIIASYFNKSDRERIFYGADSLARRIDKYNKKVSNPFLIRLQLDYGRTKKQPDLIKFIASKEDYVDNLSIYTSFAYLLESTNQEERSIGEDLITYFYINGGIQQATEWGKYIHPKYLKNYQNGALLKHIKEFEWKADDNFFIQYFQHNPKELQQLTAKDVQLSENKAVLVGDGSISPDLFKVDKQTEEIDVFTGDIIRELYLFKKVSTDGETTTYQRIAKLGKTSYKEYQSTDNATSTININYKKIEEPVVTTKQNPPINDVKTIDNSISYESEDLLSSLDKVTDEKWKPVIEILKKSKLLKGVPVKYDTQMYAAGRIEWTAAGSKVFINPTLSPNIEKILVHEAVHVPTMALLKGRVPLTDKQKEIVGKIKNIVDTLRERVLSGEFDKYGWKAEELREFDSMYTKYRDKQSLSIKEQQRMLQLRPLYYGITSNVNNNEVKYEEFVTELMTQEKFQNTLNQIPYDQKKTLLDRFLDLLSSLINTFGLREDSLATEAIKNVLQLIETTEEVAPKKKSLFDTTNKTVPGQALSLSEAMPNTYADLILAYRTRLNLISENIGKAAGDKVRQEQLKEKKKEIIEELKEFENEAALETVLNIAKKDLQEVNNLLEQSNISHNDMWYALNSIKTWQNSKKTLLTTGDFGTIRNKLVNEVVSEANDLYDKWEQITKRSLLKTIKETTGIKTLTQDVLNAQNKINALTANLLDISESGNYVLIAMDKWMREANDRANIEAVQIQKQVEQLTKDIQQTKEYKKDGFYTFAQVDKDGKLTGKVVNEYSDEYYAERRAYKSAAYGKKGTERASAVKAFNNWTLSNHAIVDIRKLYVEDKDGFLVESEDEAYVAELQKKAGDIYKQAREEQRLLIEDYNNRLEGIINNAEQLDQVKKWIAANSPLVYLNGLFTTKVYQKVGGKRIYNKGEAFVYKRPIKKWKDTKYEIIQKDKALKAYYDYTLKTLNTLYHYIPYKYRENMNLNDIPNVNKGLIEEYNEKGLQGAYRQWVNNRIESISVSEEEAEVGKKINPITKKKEYSLQVKYLQELSPEEKSYDLSKVLNMFAITSLNYKHKAQIEDQLKLSYEILQNSLEVVKDVSGNVAFDKFGRKYLTKDLRNFQDMLDYSIESFYGQRKLIQGVTKKKVYTNKAKTKQESIEAAVKSGTYSEEVRKIIEKDLGIKDQTALIKNDKRAIKLMNTKLENFVNQNTRYTAGSKIGDVILNVVQLKGMGLNLFGGITNVAYGWFANYSYAAGGVDFDLKNLKTANGIMLNSTLKSASSIENKTAKKVRALMEKYSVLKELNDVAYKDTTDLVKARRGIQNLSIYEFQKRGEYFVQGMTMVAMLLNKQIEVSLKGQKQTIPLWEAYNEKGEWLYDKDSNWEGDVQNKNDLKEYFKFAHKITQVNKFIHGNYDPNSPVRIKKGVLGRATMQFRSWIAEGVNQRYGNRKYDLLLEREREGRYSTAYNLGFVNTLKAFMRLSVGKDISSLIGEGEANPELIKENMKRNLAELYQKGFLLMMYFLLKSIEIDEDDWEKRLALNFTFNQVLRLQDDIEFFYNPQAAENITQNFIPAFALVRDTYKFYDALEDGILEGEWEYQTGKKSGENKLLWTGAKLFPGGSATVSLINKTQNEESFRK